MTRLALPPLLNGICVNNPFQTAVEQVRMRKAGAGDLFWSNEEDTAILAIVLEPEVPLSRAVEMVPLATVALSDCLAILLPPKVAVQFRDHHQIILNGGIVGGVRAAIAKTRTANEIPDWLIVEIAVVLRREDAEFEPGTRPDVTTLAEEGCEDCSLNRFIETFARHFLSWLAAWDSEGFAPVVRAWKVKDEDENDPDLQTVLREITLFESIKSDG